MRFHLYADDIHLYTTFLYNDENDMIDTKHQIEDCLSEISHWMNKNKLKLNQDKTELLLIQSKFRKEPTFAPLSFGTEIITPSKSAKDISVTFDSTMSLSTHTGLICKSAFFHQRNIARIRKCLSFKTTAILIHAFVTSKVDYCNSIYMDYQIMNCRDYSGCSIPDWHTQV